MDTRLIWLALGTFAVGVEGFVIATLLPAIAADSGVTITQAGYLVFAYAIAYAVGAPVLSALTGRFDRRPLLAVVALVFAAGALLAALLALVMLLSLSAGASDASALKVLRDWLSTSSGGGDILDARDRLIIYDIRLPRIVMGAMQRRAEESRAAAGRLAERQQGQAEQALAAARSRIEIVDPLAIALPSTGLPASRTVVALEHVRAGYDGGAPVIDDLSLTITGPERLAITGPNGSGKSTLLALIAGTLTPWSGSVRVAVPFALFDQRVALLDPALSIADNFLRRNPGVGNNACRAALARFRFRADAADRIVGTLSGGQMLRAGLACVLGAPQPPQMLILDEPGNHLDLDSLAAIETGLAAYDGALIVVSHDPAFLDAIGVSRELALGSGPINSAIEV